MSSQVRTISTGLFSDKAAQICSSVLGQLSDGWGENNPRNDRYWMYARVRQQPDGEVVIDVSLNRWRSGSEYGNAFADMTEAQVKEFFAKMIKKTAKMELNDTGVKNGWKRDNVNFKSDYLGNHSEEFGPVVTISDIYFVYEYLLDRKSESRYPKFVVERIMGTKRSEEEANTIREITKKKNEMKLAYEKVTSDLYAEEKAAAEWKKYQAALDEMKASQIA